MLWMVTVLPLHTIYVFLHIRFFANIYVLGNYMKWCLEIPGLPVTIRLLDPPLHEFLPEGDLEQIVSELTTETGMTEDEVYSRIEKLSEVNPMLGFRGCRFVILLIICKLWFLLKY